MAHEHAHKSNQGRAFLVGITLNLAFVATETAFGIRAHLKLKADDFNSYLEEDGHPGR